MPRQHKANLRKLARFSHPLAAAVLPGHQDGLYWVLLKVAMSSIWKWRCCCYHSVRCMTAVRVQAGPGRGWSDSKWLCWRVCSSGWQMCYAMLCCTLARMALWWPPGKGSV